MWKKIPFQRINQKLTVSLFLSLVFFLLVFLVVSTTMPGVSTIKVTVQLDHPDRIQLFYSNGIRKELFQEKYSVESEIVAPGQRQTIRFSIGDNTIRRLRIDTGNYPGRVRLYQISIHSHFIKKTILDPDEIHNRFRPAAANMTYRLENQYVEIISTNEDPQLISITPLIKNSTFVAWGIPFIAAIIFFFMINQFDIHNFAPIADINTKKPSNGNNINALDGLRCLAIVMVVTDHTWGRFTGLGTGGVWLFMSLSGFLLTKSFIDKSDQRLTISTVRSYAQRRVIRIIPAYYTYIIIVYFLNFQFDETIRHFLFVQGNGHLWVIPQLMVFYIILPIIVAFNYYLLRNKPWPIILALTISMFLANRYLDESVISLYGMMHNRLPLYAGIFLAGIIFAYLYYRVYLPFEKKISKRINLTRLFAALAFILILFFILGSTERLWGGKRPFAQIYFQWYGIAAGLLIFSIMAAKNTWFNRLLSNRSFRFIGIVSYSLYLFHPLVLNISRKAFDYYLGYKLVNVQCFIFTLAASLIVASFAYTFIEKPFFQSGEKNNPIEYQRELLRDSNL